MVFQEYTCSKGLLNMYGIIFSFSHSNKIKLLKFKVMNNDFPDSMMYLLEQTLSKAACKRN